MAPRVHLPVLMLGRIGYDIRTISPDVYGGDGVHSVLERFRILNAEVVVLPSGSCMCDHRLREVAMLCLPYVQRVHAVLPQLRLIVYIDHNDIV